MKTKQAQPPQTNWRAPPAHRTNMERLKQSAADHSSVNKQDFKVIVGVLNKVAQSNVKKLSATIAGALGVSNVSKFVHLLFQRCGRESHLVDTYSTMVGELCRRGDRDRPVIHAIRQSLQSMYMSWMFHPTNEEMEEMFSGDEYSQLCSQTSLKAVKTNQLDLLLTLARDHPCFKINIRSHDLVQRILHSIHSICVATDAEHNWFKVEFVLSQLHMIVSRRHIQHVSSKDIELLQTNLSSICVRNKTRFAIMDVFDMMRTIQKSD